VSRERVALAWAVVLGGVGAGIWLGVSLYRLAAGR
jgi:hypothetical protein